MGAVVGGVDHNRAFAEAVLFQRVHDAADALVGVEGHVPKVAQGLVLPGVAILRIALGGFGKR